MVSASALWPVRHSSEGTDLPSSSLPRGARRGATGAVLWIRIAVRSLLSVLSGWLAGHRARASPVGGAGGVYGRRLPAVKRLRPRELDLRDVLCRGEVIAGFDLVALQEVERYLGGQAAWWRRPARTAVHRRRLPTRVPSR